MKYALQKTISTAAKKSMFSTGEKTRHYTISDAAQPPVVTLTASDGARWPDHECHLTIEGQDFHVVKRRERWYHQWKYFLIDEKNIEVAQIEWLRYGTHHWFSSKPKRPNAIIHIKYNSFEFRRLKPTIKTKLFDTSTWGHYHYTISAPGGISATDFNFQLSNEKKWSSNPDKEFTGEINTTSTEYIILGIGLFLIDLEIKYEAAAAAASGSS